MSVSAVTKYEARVMAANSLLCVGLDSDAERIPARFKAEDSPQFAFNRWIIDQTADYASAFKLNVAFYETQGESGWAAMRQTVAYLKLHHPQVLVIADAKRGDIGNTSANYAAALFDDLDFDAVTLSPYLGQVALQPFLDRTDKGCIILARTSNPGAMEFQGLLVEGRPLWEHVITRVRDHWNSNGNGMLVVGATNTADLRRARELAGNMLLLVPGVGAQGGDAGQVVQAGQDENGRGLIVNASRSIIFADDPAAAAQSLRDALNTARR